MSIGSSPDEGNEEEFVQQALGNVEMECLAQEIKSSMEEHIEANNEHAFTNIFL